LLQQLLGGTAPLYIPKIQLQVNVEPKYYDDIIIDADINEQFKEIEQNYWKNISV
jgi:hypothetical protein